MKNVNGLNATGNYIEPGYIICVLKKRLPLIVIITLLAVAAGTFYSYRLLQPSYTARTLLQVTRVTGMPANSQSEARSDRLDSIPGSAYLAPVPTMNTYLGEMGSEALMQRVIDTLGLEEQGYTPRVLGSQVKATVDKDSYLIELSVKNRDPALAVNIANTLSKEYMVMISEKNRYLIDHSLRVLQEQAAAVNNELAVTTDPAGRERLQGTLSKLYGEILQAQIARQVDLGSVSLVVISPAVATYPATPGKLQIIVAALILGLMVSLGLAFMLNSVGDKIEEAKPKVPAYQYQISSAFLLESNFSIDDSTDDSTVKKAEVHQLNDYKHIS